MILFINLLHDRRLCVLYANTTNLQVPHWNTEVNFKSSCTNYRIFKTDLEFEEYLTILNQRDRIRFCRFRCNNSKIPIVTGRYQGIERDNRICPLCTNDQLGDEFHYLFQCPSLAEERRVFLKQSYNFRPNTLKMNHLLNSHKGNELAKLAKFCHCILKKFN